MDTELFDLLMSILPLLFGIWFLLWLYFSYLTYKQLSGIKRRLGTEYYLLPNKWPGFDNPDTRKAIRESPELSKIHRTRTRIFIISIAYFFVVIIPVFFIPLMFGYGKT